MSIDNRMVLYSKAGRHEVGGNPKAHPQTPGVARSDSTSPKIGVVKFA
jgi:hypothetical protein